MSTQQIAARAVSIGRRTRTAAVDPVVGFVEGGLSRAYPLEKRILWSVLAMLGGILVAGMWNSHAADGFGKDVVAANLIGNSSQLAGSFAEHGAGFGVIFAGVAGLAATFTACNCVVYAMLPGLACSTDKTANRRHALQALGWFSAGVVGVGLAYGAYVGGMGVDRVGSFNDTRLPQAEITFSVLGALMLVWGAISLGFLDGVVRRVPPSVQAFVARPVTRAGIMGLLVGLFAVGRPYPVFRDFLTYAASAQSPLYGALVMGVQGVGQIALMVVLFLAMVFLLGNRLARWVEQKPQQQALLSALALMVGGSYFVFYWGISIATGIGRWGFKFGIYQ